jgi:hypothetical protein
MLTRLENAVRGLGRRIDEQRRLEDVLRTVNESMRLSCDQMVQQIEWLEHHVTAWFRSEERATVRLAVIPTRDVEDR